MAEYLDVYDANKKYVGTADRNVVHTFGLWHKTVHCWVVVNIDDKPMLVFQRRSRNLNDNAGKLYTTASGHVSANETLESAFKREITEEIGLPITSLNPKHLYETVWIADIKRKDGSLFIDRVFCNVYYSAYNGRLSDFKFEDGEVDGLVAVDLKDIIEFLNYRIKSVSGIEFNGTSISNVVLSSDDFVINDGETLQGKYGRIADLVYADLKL